MPSTISSGRIIILLTEINFGKLIPDKNTKKALIEWTKTHSRTQLPAITRYFIHSTKVSVCVQRHMKLLFLVLIMLDDEVGKMSRF